MATSKVLMFLIRGSIVILCGVSIIFVFGPTYLHEITAYFPLRDSFINLIDHFPGFNSDWISVIELLLFSGVMYFILFVAFLFGYLVIARRDFQGLPDNNQWSLLRHVIVGDSADYSGAAGNPNRNLTLSASVNSYSRSSLGMGAIGKHLLVILLILYLGYRSLKADPVTGGLVARLLDALFIGFFCYSVFSVFMWLVLVFISLVLIHNRGKF